MKKSKRWLKKFLVQYHITVSALAYEGGLLVVALQNVLAIIGVLIGALLIAFGVAFLFEGNYALLGLICLSSGLVSYVFSAFIFLSTLTTRGW